MAINVEMRDARIKPKQLRDHDKVPAIIYGGSCGNVNLLLSYSQISHVIHDRLIELNISGYKESSDNIASPCADGNVHAIVRDIQYHPVTDMPQHVDFQQVSEKSIVKVKVPFIFLNGSRCHGIKMGGVLNIVHRYVTVLCSPFNIPKGIEIDLTDYRRGSSLNIQKVKFPENVKPINKFSDVVIFTITGRAEEEE